MFSVCCSLLSCAVSCSVCVLCAFSVEVSMFCSVCCIYVYFCSLCMCICLQVYYCVCVISCAFVCVCVGGIRLRCSVTNPIPPLYGYLCGYRVRIIKAKKTQPLIKLNRFDFLPSSLFQKYFSFKRKKYQSSKMYYFTK